MAALALTTADLVKQMSGVSGTSRDALIATLIAEVSAEAEAYMRRWTLCAARTEIYELKVNHRYLSVDGFPITSSVTLQYNGNQDFSTVDTLDTSIYTVDKDAGQIDFHSLAAWFDPGYVRVVYTGGMAMDTAGFVLAYPRISAAATREVVNRLNRASRPEGNVQGAAGMQLVYQKELKPLEDFYAALDHRRRLKP